MLVLSRRLNEKITFPELGITVTVINLSNGRVHLGVDAPRHVRISRPDAQRKTPATSVGGRQKKRIPLAAG